MKIIKKHKYKFLFAFIVVAALVGGIIYFKKKKAKEATITDSKETKATVKEQPLEPLTIDEHSEPEPLPLAKEELRPAVIKNLKEV